MVLHGPSDFTALSYQLKQKRLYRIECKNC